MAKGKSIGEDELVTSNDIMGEMGDVESVEMPNTGSNPFNAKVKEREYTKVRGTVDASMEIPEAEIQRPKIPSLDEMESTEPQLPKDDFNPAMNEMSKKEVKESSAQLATVIIEGYAKLKKSAGKMIEVTPKKQKKLAEEGLRMNMLVPYNAQGEEKTVDQIFKEFNSDAAKVFETTDEFKEEIHAPLSRVLAKRNVGMTDEQLLMYMFGQDIVVTSINAIKLARETKNLASSLVDYAKSGQASYTRPQSASQQSKESESSSVDDFMTGNKAKEAVKEEPSFEEPDFNSVDESEEDFIEEKTESSKSTVTVTRAKASTEGRISDDVFSNMNLDDDDEDALQMIEEI